MKSCDTTVLISQSPYLINSVFDPPPLSSLILSSEHHDSAGSFVPHIFFKDTYLTINELQRLNNQRDVCVKRLKNESEVVNNPATAGCLWRIL